MNRNKAVLSIIAISLMAGCSSVTATSSNASSDAEGETQPISIAMINDMTTMDSSLATDEASYTLISLCQSGLTCFDQDKNVTGDLAESWDVSEDGLTYTFHLRDGIQWSDGEPITADDFVYGWRRLVDPDTASEFSYIMASINVVNAQDVIDGKVSPDQLGVEAPDDQTFVVHLSVPCSFLLSCITNPQFYPLKESFVEAQGDQYALSPENILYSGVYTMTDWQTGNSYTFTRNDKYWDAENHPQQQITMQYVQDPQTAMLEYENGDLDFVTLSGDMVDAYENTEGYTSTLTSGVWWLAPNMNDTYLSNNNLRTAISYAINREELCNDVLKTGAVPAGGLIAEGLVKNSEGTDFRDAAGTLTSYDKNKASEYYAKAVEEIGKDPEIDILYDDADDSSKVAVNLQQMIQEACPGITVNLDAKPKKTRIEKMLNHDFSIVLTRWVPDYADPQSYLDTLTTGASMNGGNYSNAQFDALEEKAVRGEDATDADKRLQDMIEAENILVAQDHGIIPLYQEGGAVIVNPNTTGYLSLVLGTGTFRYMTKKA